MAVPTGSVSRFARSNVWQKTVASSALALSACAGLLFAAEDPTNQRLRLRLMATGRIVLIVVYMYTHL
jgi:hypothetical protein